MEDIAADDDLLSYMLVDSIEYNPPIHTHKMNQAYRPPRYRTEDVSDLVRNRVVIDQDINGALEELCRINVVRKHLAAKKDERQRQEFRSHAKRYLETYLPDSGTEFALTFRYKRASHAETSRAGQAQAEAQARAEVAATVVANAPSPSLHNHHKGKGRASESSGEALGSDLCVVATKPFKAGDLIKLCRGGVKDLNKQEDEALKEEAALGRERRKEQSYNGVLGPGRDFSIIRSSRKMCSQLLLGPARFVNHDCNPNCEFYRAGHSNMLFRCVRDIGINEEITTFYGENYFESGNAECMCMTCEERGNGIFTPAAVKTENGHQSVDGIDGDKSEEHEPKSQRRVSSRKMKSPPPAAQTDPKTTVVFQRKDKDRIVKTFNHIVSSREDDGDAFPHAGIRFRCLTCGEPSWSPADWWEPDECRRCEHHYRVFKADWPGRSPTEGVWQDKARASRLRRQLADDIKTGRPSEPLSADTTPEVGSPISLEPIGAARKRSSADGHSKRRSSTTPPATSAPRRKKRYISDDEVKIPRNSEEPVRCRSDAVARSKRILRESDAESDLTSVSAQDTDESAAQTRTLGRESPSSSSSTSSSHPLGPRSLGKDAKTNVLARYWGAEEGNKRARRPVHNGLEQLSSTVQSKHRRIASDATISSPKNKSSRLSPKEEAASARVHESASLPPESHLDAGEFNETADASVQTDRKIMRTTSENLAHLAAKRDSPIDINGLATRGPERTSNSNLAKAWGADVDGGRGSRRRIVSRNTGTPTLLSSPKRELRSGSPESAAYTPPTSSKSTVRQPGLGEHTLRSTSVPRRMDHEASPNMAVQNALIPEAETDKAAVPMHVLPSTESSHLPEPAKAAIKTDPDQPIVSLPQPESPTPASPAFSKANAEQGQSAQRPIETLHAERVPIDTPSSLVPSSHNVPAEPPTIQRTTSPLAGPPPSKTTSHPLVVLGQPIRKNLRWGSAKTSMSRALPAPGSPFSLAGPAAGPPMPRPMNGLHPRDVAPSAARAESTEQSTQHLALSVPAPGSKENPMAATSGPGLVTTLPSLPSSNGHFALNLPPMSRASGSDNTVVPHATDALQPKGDVKTNGFSGGAGN